MKVLLDPGHSISKLGAQSGNPNINEYDMNVLQAKTIQVNLTKAGIQAVIIDPVVDDLNNIGSAAKDYDMFVSLHLNAADHKEHYTTCCIHSERAKPESEVFGKLLASKVAHDLNLPLYHGDGITKLKLIVLGAAEKVCKGPCVLSEAYFVDAYKDLMLMKERTIIAANAISDAIIEWSKGNVHKMS